MERYSRLVQFFSSPDKTLGELYPFSPYTSNIPLAERSIPVESLSLTSSDDDFSGSEFSQASSGNESSLSRKLLLDDPPSRLHLKRRPKRRTQQSDAEENQKLSSEDRQTDLNVAKCDTNLWKEAPMIGSLLERTPLTFRDSDLPPRPPSRRKESRECGSARGSDRGNEIKTSLKLGNSVHRKDNATRDRSSQERDNNDNGIGDRGSLERARSSDSHERYSSGRSSHNQGSSDRESHQSSNRGNNDRSSSGRVGNCDKGSRERCGSDSGSRDRGRSDRESHLRERSCHDRASGVRRAQDRRSDRGSLDRHSSDSSDRGSQDHHRPDRTNQSLSSRDKSSPDGTRKRKAPEKSAGRNSPQFTTTPNTQDRQAEYRTRNQEQIHRRSTDQPESHLIATEESHRPHSRTRKTNEHVQQDTELPRPPDNEPSHRTQTAQRNKETAHARPNQNLDKPYSRHYPEDKYELQNEVPQRGSETSRRTNSTRQRKSEPYQRPCEITNRSVTEQQPRSALSDTHPQPEESIHRTTIEKSAANAGLPLPRERRYRTSNFTLPSSLTVSPTNFQSELFHETDAAFDRGSPTGYSERNLEEQQESSLNSFPLKSSGKVSRSPPKMQAGLRTESPSKFSDGPPTQSTNRSSTISSAGSPINSPFFESSQWYTQHPSEEPQLSTKPVSASSAQQKVTLQSRTEPEKDLTTVPERHSKIKTWVETRDKIYQTRNLFGEHQIKSTSIQTQRPHKVLVGDVEMSPTKVEPSAYLLERGKWRTSPLLVVSSNKIESTAMDDTTQTTFPSPKKRSQVSDAGGIETEGKFSQSGVHLTAAVERTEVNHAQGNHATSWQSSSSSDITDGESILDIEKFKQTIRSVEVPPEFLEPLDESEESDNLLNILETISESPLEDCSDVHNSSNYGDDEHGSTDEVTRQSQFSGIPTQRQPSRDHTPGDHRDNSTSDLSDIQLHYAYGRNKNDQLELQWIKLEKVVDTSTASESSEGSAIESPFNRYGKSTDLHIRSVNLPNASTAQRHGDADRGPIATYLTLPTQSPATGEDPELAIIVLHEDNLSEHQKQVINRFRTGMKRRRSRSSSELRDHPSANQLLLDQVEQPLIIPISDPNTGACSTTGFAVIADSEPEVPLSVDVDVKSWLAKQHVDEDEPPILVNRCNSKAPSEFSHSSYSETNVPRENRQHEPNRLGPNTAKSPDKVSRNVRDSCTEGRRQYPNAIQRRGTPYTARRNEAAAEHVPKDRPKTAPPSEGNTFSGYHGQGTNDQKLQLKRRSRNPSPETPSQKTPHTSQRTIQCSQNKAVSRPESPQNPPLRDANSTQRTPLSTARSLKSPSSEKRPADERAASSAQTNTKREAMNKPDNTIHVLFEPKGKPVCASKEEARKSKDYNRIHIKDNKSKPTEVDQSSGSVRPQSSSSPRNRQAQKSQGIENPKLSRPNSSQQPRPKTPERPISKIPERSISMPPERPRTASPGPEKNRLQGFRGHDITKESRKTPEKRSQKRSSSVSASTTPEHGSLCSDLHRVGSNTSIISRDSSRTHSLRKPAAPEKQPLRPQTAPTTNGRLSGNVETLPMCDSCESSASTDSGGVPRYRLKRNIAYLSEYRKTIDSLRTKCVMKDHMIDALLEELQRLSPTEETYKRLLVKLSNRKLNGPPPRRDYSCCEVADLLPKDRGETLPEPEIPVPQRVGGAKCVCPSDFRIAGKVGCDCLLLTWKSAAHHETVAGYEVDVNGQLTQHVRSPTRTSALLMDLDLSREMRFKLRTLRTAGLQACHPPLEILFAPSGDDWALDDLGLPSAAAKPP